MSEHYLVAVVGRPGTGTSQLTEMLTDYLDVDHRDIDDFLRKNHNAENLGVTGNIDEQFTLMTLYKEIRRRKPTEVIDYCLEDFETMKPQGRVLSGLRNQYDIGELSVKARCFTIGLEASVASAWNRYRTEHPVDPSDFGKFLLYSDYVGASGEKDGSHIDTIIATSINPLGITLDANRPTSELFWESVGALQTHSLI